jgi:hypothetical protein
MKEIDQDYPISRAFFTERNWFPPSRRGIDPREVHERRASILSDLGILGSCSTGDDHQGAA